MPSDEERLYVKYWGETLSHRKELLKNTMSYENGNTILLCDNNCIYLQSCSMQLIFIKKNATSPGYLSPKSPRGKGECRISASNIGFHET